MPRSRKPTVSAVVATFGACLSLSGQAIDKPNRAPRLAFTAPAELYHSALRPPEVYESTQTNASVQVYVFRQAPAGVEERFQRTLMREWIVEGYQERQLTGPPSIRAGRIPGAALSVAHERRARGGLPRHADRQHLAESARQCARGLQWVDHQPD